jgi:hypothetical protein
MQEQYALVYRDLLHGHGLIPVIKGWRAFGLNWGARVGAMGEYYFADNYAIISGIGFGFNQGGTFQNGYSRGIFWPSSKLSQPGLDTLPLNAKLQYHVTNVESSARSQNEGR